MSKQLNTRIQYKYDTESAWAEAEDSFKALPGELIAVKADDSSNVTLKFGDAYAHNNFTMMLDASLEYPSCDTSEFTYTGEFIQPTIEYSDSTHIVTTGTLTARDAGTYKIYFVPTKGYAWKNLTTDYRLLEWSIKKVKSSIETTTNKVSLSVTNPTQKIQVTTNVRDKIQVSVSDTTYLTAKLVDEINSDGSIATYISITGLVGTSVEQTVTLYIQEESNYEGAAATISVDLSEVINKTLNNNSWATISLASEKGIASNYWSIGDCKEITLNGKIHECFSANDLKVNVYIIDFNHVNGSTTTEGIHFGTFKNTNYTDIVLVDTYYGYSMRSSYVFNMNHWANTSLGGWKDCDLRYDILGSTDVAPTNYDNPSYFRGRGQDASKECATKPVSNTLMSLLPEDLRAVMKPLTIYTDNQGEGYGSSSSYVTTSVDYLPLLSEFELYGIRYEANSYEKNYQTQYTYYKDGNSKLKYSYANPTSLVQWWLRSAEYNISGDFMIVQYAGGTECSDAYYSLGICPIFRV